MPTEMRRGDVVIVATGGGYGGKPRPAVIVQADAFMKTDSLTMCLLSSRPVPEAPTLRVAVDPDEMNQLRVNSWIMVDKVVTIPRAKLGPRIGSLAPAVMERLDSALLLFLGLSASGEVIT
jgi:mRNA interferase MazF